MMRKDSSTAAGFDTQLCPGAPAPPAEVLGSARALLESYPLSTRLLLPSITDMIFVVLVCMLVFAPVGAGLLNDADTGWHIRNGQHIVSTLSVPHADYFSYTMSGKPWYAWEWLYDAGMGLIGAGLGLNGVMLFTAIVVGFTFALLFRSLLARGSNLAVAAVLTVAVALSAQVHMLARPHVVGWLLTLVWLRLLYRFQVGHAPALRWLPLLMLLWVNVHGSFGVGLVLLVLFLAGNLWTYVRTLDPQQKQGAQHAMSRIAAAGLLCLLASLVTPYGYKLHLHVYHYLSNRYFMDHISEFAAPRFHGGAEKYFEGLLALALLSAVFAGRKLRGVDVLLVLFAAYGGLFAIRNVPVSSLLIAMAIAPALSEALRSAAQRSDVPGWMGRACARVDAFSARMANLETAFSTHLLPLAVLLGGLTLALNGGRLLSKPVLAAQFDGHKFPVAAADFVAAKGIRDHMFSTDRWSGYLIYRLYPDTKLFIDDRHDLYGEEFVKDYLKVLGADLGWRRVLDKNEINWVLVPPDVPLANVLKETLDWKVAYDDGVGILFARTSPPGPASSVGR